MFKLNPLSKSDTRHPDPLLVAIVCVFALFTGCVLEGKNPTDERTTANTLVATEGVEHLGRLAREPMAVELSDGTLLVSGYDGDLEKAPNLWRQRPWRYLAERECRSPVGWSNRQL